MSVDDLARQRRCIEQIRERWPEFSDRRSVHLRSHAVGQVPCERIAENILFDLFTVVLDWIPEQVRWQEGRVDLLLTRLGPAGQGKRTTSVTVTGSGSGNPAPCRRKRSALADR